MQLNYLSLQAGKHISLFLHHHLEKQSNIKISRKRICSPNTLGNELKCMWRKRSNSDLRLLKLKKEHEKEQKYMKANNVVFIINISKVWLLEHDTQSPGNIFLWKIFFLHHIPKLERGRKRIGQVEFWQIKDTGTWTNYSYKWRKYSRGVISNGFFLFQIGKNEQAHKVWKEKARWETVTETIVSRTQLSRTSKSQLSQFCSSSRSNLRFQSQSSSFLSLSHLLRHHRRQ